MGCFQNKKKMNLNNIEEEESQKVIFQIDNNKEFCDKKFLRKKKKRTNKLIIKKYYIIDKKKKEVTSSDKINEENNSLDENNKNNDNKIIKKNNEIEVHPNIIQDINNKNLINCYSYELISRIHSFKVKKGTKNEVNFKISLKNNGNNIWPKDYCFLRYHYKNCPELFLDNVELGELDVNDIKNVDIKFDNLNSCKIGKYQALFHVFIKGKIVGAPIVIYFDIIE